jgi:putative transcriptional regulator
VYSPKKSGKRLSKARKAKKKTMAEVAKALNIAVSTVYMHEAGQRTPSPELMDKYARYYETDVQTLFFG